MTFNDFQSFIAENAKWFEVVNSETPLTISNAGASL